MSVRAQEGGQHIGTHLPALLQAKGLHMRSQVLRKHVVPKGFVMGGWGRRMTVVSAFNKECKEVRNQIKI